MRIVDAASDAAIGPQRIDDTKVAGLANPVGLVHRGAQRLRHRGAGVEEIHICAARPVVTARHGLGNAHVLARPADSPFVHAPDAVRPVLA